MKGIILAGGTGSRLWPTTLAVSKQLIPIYDKPLIFYPLSTLMLAGIREILIITTAADQAAFKNLLGDGSTLGINILFAIQDKPDGLARAFTIGETFIGESEVSLILGDNIFHGSGLGRELQKSTKLNGAQIFGYQVTDPQRYGVAELGPDGTVLSIEEKPQIPKSNFAIPGLYFFDNSVIEKAKKVTPSPRGEYEITSVLEMYRLENGLTINLMPRGTTWMDCGTAESLNDACNYIRAVEERQGLKVAVVEEIAWRNGWISSEQLRKISDFYGKSQYGKYLSELANG